MIPAATPVVTVTLNPAIDQTLSIPGVVMTGGSAVSFGHVEVLVTPWELLGENYE